MNRISSLLIAIAAISISGTAIAQSYPNRALRLIVPFSAGGITDFAARQVAKELGDVLGQSVIVENRAGAGGLIGAKELLSAPLDGYTLFIGTVGTQTVNPLLFKKLPYDPDRQFVPIGLATNTPSMLAVRSNFPARTLDEFVAYAKANPGKLNYAAAGTLHLGIETLKTTYGLDIVKVPYKGSGEAVAAVAGSQVDFLMDGSPTVMPQVQGGKLKALVVMGDKPLKSAPGVPTTTQIGSPELKASNWTALYVAAGTSQPIVDKLNASLRRALSSEDLANRLADYGTQLYKGTFEEYAAFMPGDKAKVKRLVDLSGLQPE